MNSYVITCFMIRNERLELSVVTQSRYSRLEKYLQAFGEEPAQQVADEFSIEGNPMSHTAVIIPVAINQDGALIESAMAQYAAQRDCDPFTIFLLLNCPEDKVYDPGTVSGMIDVEKARQKYRDQLDIRVAHMAYIEPRIGKIRKDLWDGVTTLAMRDNLYNTPSSDVLGINHDIDTEYMSPRYIASIQDHYRTAQDMMTTCGFADSPLQPVYTQTSHSYPSVTHPNTAKGVFWIDMAYHQSFRSQGGGYEAGMVIPLSMYARRGGFDPGSVTHETGKLMPMINDRAPMQLPRTILKTSPRRYVERFPTEGYGRIWTKDTFGPSDACRDQDTMIGSRDSTIEELNQHIRQELDRHLDLFVDRAVGRASLRLSHHTNTASEEHLNTMMTEADKVLNQEIERQRRLAAHVLEHTLGLLKLSREIYSIDLGAVTSELLSTYKDSLRQSSDLA